MHQNRWWLGLCPRPQCGSLQRSPDPLARLRGLLLRGGKRSGGEGELGRGKENPQARSLATALLNTRLDSAAASEMSFPNNRISDSNAPAITSHGWNVGVWSQWVERGGSRDGCQTAAIGRRDR